MGFRRLSGWEPSFCSLDRLIGVLRLGRLVVGNLHSVALIDLKAAATVYRKGWEPSLGTFIL